MFVFQSILMNIENKYTIKTYAHKRITNHIVGEENCSLDIYPMKKEEMT